MTVLYLEYTILVGRDFEKHLRNLNFRDQSFEWCKSHAQSK